MPDEPKFPMGRLLMTPGVRDSVKRPEIEKLLQRHNYGDWGELDEDDVAQNELGLEEGLRLMSAYTAGSGQTVWVITEADRSVTTLLLPEEY